MANADEIARLGKRFVKIFYDPIPRNDDTSGAPIWCLGTRYESAPPLDDSFVSVSANSPQDSAISRASDHPSSDDDIHREPTHTPRPQELAVSKDAALKATDTSNDDGGWPAPFLHDFDSRIWFTYRSGYAVIPKSQQPNAAGALSFAVRLRSQLGQPDGFTSDTGWGCMIRSGQSLLANALVLSRLGRGMEPSHSRTREYVLMVYRLENWHARLRGAGDYLPLRR
jgi:cysteine protease ATG4